jgi:hypothetical protein
MSETHTTETQILIAKCQHCGHITKVEREWKFGVVKSGPRAGQPARDLLGGYVINQCEACFKFLADTKIAKTSQIKCGARCTGATGPACSCECGGKNHSRTHSL